MRLGAHQQNKNRGRSAGRVRPGDVTPLALIRITDASARIRQRFPLEIREAVNPGLWTPQIVATANVKSELTSATWGEYESGVNLMFFEVTEMGGCVECSQYEIDPPIGTLRVFRRVRSRVNEESTWSIVSLS